MKKFVFIISMLSLVLTSCGYATEIDDSEYLIAIGIDKGSKYHERITFVFATPTEGDSEAANDDKTDIIILEAATFYSALRQINSIKSKIIDLTHTKMITVSEEIAREGVKDLVYGFVNSRDFRPNTLMCISECTAEEYLSSVRPSSEITIEKYFDLLMDKLVSNSVNETYLYHLYFNMQNDNIGSLVYLVNKNENTLPERNNSEIPFTDDFSFNKTAGELVRSAKNETEVIGTAVFYGDKMVGKFGSLESDMAKLINNEFPTEYYSFLYPGTNDYVTLRLVQRSKPQKKVFIQGDNVTLSLKIPLRASYVDVGRGISGVSDLNRFEAYLDSVFEKKCAELIIGSREKYGCDFFGFEKSAKCQFITIPSWEKFNWREKYKNAPLNVKFDIKITDSEELRYTPE